MHCLFRKAIAAVRAVALAVVAIALLAQVSQAQSISSVSPDSALAGSTVDVTITGIGTNFQAGSTTLIMGSTSIGAAIENITSPTGLIATIPIPASAPTGWYDVDKDSLLLPTSFWIGNCMGACGTISGTVWNDVNSNGVLDGAEQPMPGIPIMLAPAGDTAYSDSSGSYEFYTELGVSYTVSVNSGTYSASCWPGGVAPGSVTLPVGSSYAVQLTGATPTSGGNDFGLGVPDVSCQIIDIAPDSILLGATSTLTVTGLGTYFQSDSTVLVLGNTTIVSQTEAIGSPTSYTCTFAVPGNVPIGWYSLIKNGILVANAVYIGTCVGSCGTIDGVAWHDANGNGLIDGGETLLSDHTVTLQPAGWTALTDSLGYYAFYAPSGIAHTLHIDSGSYSASCWQGNILTGSVLVPNSGNYTVTLTGGGTVAGGNNFGIAVPDTSCQLVNVSPDSSLVDTTITLLITGLGTYFQSDSTVLTDGITTLVAVSENIVSPTSYTATFNIPANASFGWYTLEKQGLQLANALYVSNCVGACGMISGMVFHDENANGIMDVSEGPVAGVAITVNPGGIALTTDAQGAYEVLLAATTTYTVTMAPGTYSANCSGAFSLTGTQTAPAGPIAVALLPPNNSSDGNNFGLLIPDTVCGFISGSAYHDDNGNGSRDVGEANWSNAELRLMPNNVSTTTDGAGGYSFDVLPDAAYTVELLTDSVALTCPTLQQQQYGGLAYSTRNYAVTPTEPVAGPHTVVVSPQMPTMSGIDFGAVYPMQCARYSGTVFPDDNQNGVQDASEVGNISAWVFNAATARWDAVDGAGTWEHFTHYDVQSEFSVQWYQANNPCGWLPSAANAQQTYPLSPVTHTATVSLPDEDTTGLDYGVYLPPPTPCGTISGTVYEDVNGNGVQDVGEFAMTGVTARIHSPALNSATYAPVNGQGDFLVHMPLGYTYVVSVNTNVSNYQCNNEFIGAHIVTQPASGSYTVALSAANPVSTGNVLGVQAQLGPNEAEARMATHWMASGNLPGEAFYGGTDFNIRVYNGSANCTLRVERDPLIAFDGMHMPWQPMPDVQSSTENIWYLNNLSPGYYSYCFLQDYTVDSSAVPGTLLEWDAEVWCDVPDPCPLNNDLDANVVVDDPNRAATVPDLNNHSVSHMGNEQLHEVSSMDTSFSYVISYQNTLGVTAHSMIIVDTLPPELDPATISVPFAPHRHTTWIEGNVLFVAFDSIMLADTSESRINSYGYVQYHINMYPGIAPGTVIKNDAYIYLNNEEGYKLSAPDVLVVAPDGIEQFGAAAAAIQVYPNPVRDALVVTHSAGSLARMRLLDLLGRPVRAWDLNGATEARVQLEGVSPGMYVLQIHHGDAIENRTIVIER